MALRTGLFYKNQKGSGGFSTVEDMARTTGNRFFVDSGKTTTGADTAGFGQTPDTPFLTLDFAVGQCTASNGDVIYLMPGHADTISSAGDLAMDVIGVKVVGLGHGSVQPTLTWDTANTATMAVTVADIEFENVHFVSNFLDVATAILLSTAATDFTTRNCRFTDTSVILNAKIWIQDGATTTSNRITVENCRAKAYGTANTHFINLAGTGDGHVIKGNILMGDWATMCVGGAGVVTDILIDDNRILNVVATADTCINVAATAEGLITNNRCAGGHATDGIVCGDCGSLENYYVDQDTDLSGVIEPAIV